MTSLVSLSKIRKRISMSPYFECSKHRVRVIAKQREKERKEGRKIKLNEDEWQPEKSQVTTVKAKQCISKCVL